jgi:adenylate cyclase
VDEGRRCAGLFVEAVRQAWRGEPAAAGTAEYVDWLVDSSYLHRPDDESHLREGLRLVGLPA